MFRSGGGGSSSSSGGGGIFYRICSGSNESRTRLVLAVVAGFALLSFIMGSALMLFHASTNDAALHAAHHPTLPPGSSSTSTSTIATIHDPAAFREAMCISVKAQYEQEVNSLRTLLADAISKLKSYEQNPALIHANAGTPVLPLYVFCVGCDDDVAGLIIHSFMHSWRSNSVGFGFSYVIDSELPPRPNFPVPTPFQPQPNQPLPQPPQLPRPRPSPASAPISLASIDPTHPPVAVAHSARSLDSMVQASTPERVRAAHGVNGVTFDTAAPGIPVLLFCFNRPDALKQTLDSIFHNRPIPAQPPLPPMNGGGGGAPPPQPATTAASASSYPIFVSQDGDNPGVSGMIDTYRDKLFHLRFSYVPTPQAQSDARYGVYYRIAAHYNFALKYVRPDSPCLAPPFALRSEISVWDLCFAGGGWWLVVLVCRYLMYCSTIV